MARHGGRREGAGRPPATGRYAGEETQVMRVPASLVEPVLAQLQEYSRLRRSQQKRRGERTRTPEKVSVDLLSQTMADGRLFTLHPEPDATFVYTVQGDAMDRAGILHGDRVVVDRGKCPADGDIVLAAPAGQSLMVKRLSKKRRIASLVPESNNQAHQSVPLRLAQGGAIWGVITGVVRGLHNGQMGRDSGTRA